MFPSDFNPEKKTRQRYFAREKALRESEVLGEATLSPADVERKRKALERIESAVDKLADKANKGFETAGQDLLSLDDKINDGFVALEGAVEAEYGRARSTNVNLDRLGGAIDKVSTKWSRTFEETYRSLHALEDKFDADLEILWKAIEKEDLV